MVNRTSAAATRPRVMLLSLLLHPITCHDLVIRGKRCQLPDDEGSPR